MKIVSFSLGEQLEIVGGWGEAQSHRFYRDLEDDTIFYSKYFRARGQANR